MVDPEMFDKPVRTTVVGFDADLIIEGAPYGILILDDALRIYRINEPACRIVDAGKASELLGKSVSKILDAEIFIQVMNTGETRKEASVYLPEYDRYVEWSLTYDCGSGKLLCFMRDITAETVERAHREQAAKKTIEITDRVIEKQMRVVQEIASLLGETTAETKTALTKLKESLNDE